jgi:hypothetical protein
MAVTNLSVEVLSGVKIFQDTDSANAAVAAKASSGTIYALDIDNTANAAVSYVKIWNTAQGSVTVGTTAPDFIFMVPASSRTPWIIPAGVALGTAITVACVTTAGTAGTTSPTSDVIVRLAYA